MSDRRRRGGHVRLNSGNRYVNEAKASRAADPVSSIDHVCDRHVTRNPGVPRIPLADGVARALHTGHAEAR